ncbi:MAG: acetylxylan esterase [Kiritimatiellaeota bacterium]|nr:acetylxylan esterase [Kiritimatiellota bacterium]
MKKTLMMVGGLLMMGNAFAEIPELMKAGTTAAQWEQVRRPELFGLFQEHVFGRNPVGRPEGLRFEALGEPVKMLDGKAIRKRVRIHYEGPGGKGQFDVSAFIPQSAKKVPAFLLVCFCPPEELFNPERDQDKSEHLRLPAEAFAARGYAVVAFSREDVTPDKKTGFTTPPHAIFTPNPEARTPTSWGTIAAWAWGASRVMDWIETEPLLDTQRVAMVGHSRCGKTALWCGANDPRIALTVSNNSGCGGAKLNRMDLPKSEHIAQITKNFSYWFCDNFMKYADNEDALPVDMHQLLALMAPRLVYVSSAEDDLWAGPEGEFESCKLASPAWALYGKKGLVGDAFPATGKPLHEGCIGYHIRSGKHDMTPYDWERFMDFADKHGWKQ